MTEYVTPAMSVAIIFCDTASIPNSLFWEGNTPCVKTGAVVSTTVNAIFWSSALLEASVAVTFRLYVPTGTKVALVIAPFAELIWNLLVSFNEYTIGVLKSAASTSCEYAAPNSMLLLSAGVTAHVGRVASTTVNAIFWSSAFVCASVAVTFRLYVPTGTNVALVIAPLQS